VAQVMRTGEDVQWWRFTAPTAGTYTVRLADLPAAYRLTAFYPGGSRSVFTSALSDRVITRTLTAGQQITISVAAEGGNGNLSEAYRLSVKDESTASAASFSMMTSSAQIGGVAQLWERLTGTVRP
jgi:hypothetical protein